MSSMHVFVYRFCARRQREIKAHDKTDSSESTYAHTRRKMEIRPQTAKPAQSKTSVLQSIYGKIS